MRFILYAYATNLIIYEILNVISFSSRNLTSINHFKNIVRIKNLINKIYINNTTNCFNIKFDYGNI